MAEALATDRVAVAALMLVLLGVVVGASLVFSPVAARRKGTGAKRKHFFIREKVQREQTMKPKWRYVPSEAEAYWCEGILKGDLASRINGHQAYCREIKRYSRGPSHFVLNDTYSSKKLWKHAADRGYITTSRSRRRNPQVFDAEFPGRRLIFDCGSGASYGSSLDWFARHYGQEGIVFDEAYAWEAAPLSGRFDVDMPPGVATVVHHRNHPIVTDPANTLDNPVTVLRRVARPGDFVVFKMDIDVPEIELPLLRQLLDDPALRGLVAELFHEYHFWNPLMKNISVSRTHSTTRHGTRIHEQMGIPWQPRMTNFTTSRPAESPMGGGFEMYANHTLQDAYRQFCTARAVHGLRWHNWP
eukprot:TRINITY_DN7395_c0_g1_i3.p1 TRINITY_DN7395_c0_g1~~TRINITY_DN7395_c0_g1_i3.p1  ORF type:complete len:376 (+),score=90.35 TRINITY_DN7395_c0_g1_i3:57-1130(+)